MSKISVIVPVYNEEKNINEFIKRTEISLSKTKLDYEIIFLLDPSTDNSEEIILNEIEKNKKIKLIVFSRRFGQPAATMAGMNYVSGSRCVIIDCDLQDPPELIYDLNKKMDEGYDVVLATRKSRQGETLTKKFITNVGYAFIEKITDIRIPKNTGDFRIISRRVIDNLKQFKEPNAFLRGLVAYIGFKQTSIEYNRERRFSGETKYNKYFGSLKIAFNGIFGFSSRPLFIMSIIGFIFAFISFFIGLYYIIVKFIDPSLTPGLSSTILFITFFSGLNLIGLGLLGEYVGRIYDEVKNRPNFIIDKKYNFDE